MKQYTPAKKILFIITVFFVLLTICKSFYFSNKTGGTDLRCRIVAARLLTTNNSPYFYKWHTGDGDFLLNPNDDAKRLVNGNVVTPAVLTVIYPLSKLPYKYIRFIWTALELLAAGIIFLLLYKKAGNTKLLTFCTVAAGLFCSDIWLFHAERGQMYIFYALGFTITYFLARQENKKGSQLLAGAIAGLLLFFRPFAGVLLIAFFIAKKWKLVQGWFIGVAAGTVLLVLPFLQQWKDYNAAMKEYVMEMRDMGTVNNNAVNYSAPAKVEEMTNLQQAQGFNIQGLGALPAYLQVAKINVSLFTGPILFIILAAIPLFVFCRANSNKPPGMPAVFVLAFLLYFIAEISFLTPRGGYNMVQWLLPLLLVLPAYENKPAIFITAAVGLLLLHNFPFYFPYQALIAELIFAGTAFLYITGSNKAKHI